LTEPANLIPAHIQKHLFFYKAVENSSLPYGAAIKKPFSFGKRL
jgi:hypothetical protein